MKKHSLAVILAVWLAGCSLLPEVQDETKTWSAQKFYTEAKENMVDGNWEKAIKLLETLESRYPYGRYAQQAQLEIAYAYYKDGNAASAIAAADRFIKLHPNHPNVDYAFYLKGLANFNEDMGLFAFVGGQDMSERDPKAARESFEAFKELATRFPNSKYTPDATARMSYLVNALASYEVHVARYYLKRGAYVAAVNRAQSVLQQYPQTPAMEEALALMAKSYDALGMKDLRDDSLRVLKKNFPNSRFLAGTDVAGTDVAGTGAKKAWWKLW